MTFLSLHFTCLCCFHAYAPSFLYLLILNFLGTLLCVSLSLSFFRLVCSMAPKKSKSTPSQNPLHSRVASSFDSTPSLVRFCDDKAHKDFLENFSRRGIHSKRQVVLSDFSDTDLPTVIYSRGQESLCNISVTCPSMIIQELYSNMHGFDYSLPLLITRVRGTRIVVAPNLISKVLCVSRVAHPDNPNCDRLKTVSKDELSSLFCETPSSWGERQNTPCSNFAKGLRFLKKTSIRIR